MARTDPALGRIRAALKAHFAVVDPLAEIRVEHGYRDNIHIRVVSDHFEPLTKLQRGDEVWPIVETAAGPEDVLRISLCIALTPEEYRASYAEPLAAA